ncbi:APC family permease [Rugosimonospora acidiphila]|uniref:APC family permease n=1 Tax=Rugosimonospora acidiphila TaxID=556531 RepID=A0ABP9S1T1_9ACTN
MPSSSGTDVPRALARDRLGIPAVVFFVLSGVAPLTVAAGVVTTAYAVTGLTSVPAAFLAVAVVLGLFSVGYVAMARHITNAGAFYAFVSRGLGRPVGVGAAMVAVVAYNLLQVGLYGAFGPSTAGFMADKLGIHAPWWVWALAAWAIVTVLGLLRVDLNGKVLAVLLSIEIVVAVALAVSGLSHPAGGHVSFATLSPLKLTTSGIGAALVIAVLGFVGFEQSAVFAEEARNPGRTVRVATYFSLAMIALLYAGASWAMAVHNGDGQVASAAARQGPELLFTMGRGILPDAGRVLFLTSLFAAALAFHNAVWRYMYALGRESVLPAVLGRTGRNNVPKTASAAQSLVGLVFIAVFALAGWDPMVKLFFWVGTTGGFGILLLIALTSIAVIRFFARDRHGETAWHRVVAPGIAAVAVLIMLGLALDNYSTLLGVAPGSTSARVLPAIFGVAAIVGIAWALVLRSIRPEVYAAIGQGREPATSGGSATGTTPRGVDGSVRQHAR